MAESRIGRYLLYAVGEIILVVIGIIIAVQINGWVNNARLKSSNKVYLEKMIGELELNKIRMEKLISYEPTPDDPFIGLEEAVQHCDSILKLTYQGLDESGIQYMLTHSMTAGGSFLNLHTSVYDELINTGRLYTIGSDSLETAIKDYYLRCEREDQYNRVNTENMGESLDLIRRTYFKLAQDYYRDSVHFDLSHYPWIYDQRSPEYQDLQLAIGGVRAAQSQNLFKMKQIIQYSDSLIVIIEKELKE